jgi:hypothetical protein
MKISPKVLILLGFSLAVAGFLYDIAFAGIPYQDPTPSLQANWETQQNVGAFLTFMGIVIFCAGGVWSVLKRVLRSS